MTTFIKAALIAGALAVTTVAVPAPAMAQRYYDNGQRYYDNGPSFGFSFNYGDPGYRYGYGPGYRNCRQVRQVWVDRWGYRHVAWRPVCRPAFRGGYPYGGRWNGRW